MKILLLMFIVLTGLVSVPVVHANADQAKARIADRLGQVDALKKAGLAGEDNKGYLSARVTLSAQQQQVLQSENADRKIIYEAIAGQLKTNVRAVGQERARSIRGSAASGVWLQNPDGSWYQK